MSSFDDNRPDGNGTDGKTRPAQEGFKPLSVSTLENFEDEVSRATDKSQPNFDRFSLLVEKPVFEESDPDVVFKALYQKETADAPAAFEHMIENRNDQGPPDPDGNREEQSRIDADDAGTDQPVEPEETPEEKGFRQGHEKGLAQGEQEGRQKGYDEGFAKGHEEGLAKGREEGFAQGESNGLEQGLEKGEAQGRQQADEKAAQILESLETALQTAESVQQTLVDTYEERLIDLVKAIARRVIMARIELDEEGVRPLVLAAFRELVQPENVVLSVSVEDYEYIEMIKDDFFDSVESLTRVSVRSDPGISRGGCRIETATASVETDVEERLAAISEAMLRAGKETG